MSEQQLEHEMPVVSSLSVHSLRYYGSAMLAALVLLVLSVFTLWQDWEQAHASAANSVLNTARILVNDVEQLFAQADALLKSVGRRYLITTRLGDETKSRLRNEVVHEVADFPLVSRITIANADGNVVFSTAEQLDQRPITNVSDRDYFIRARSGEAGPFYAGPLQARIGGEWSLLMARRLTSPGGAFLGVVIAVAPVEEIGRFFAAIDLGLNGIINLRAADLAQVVRYPALAGEARGIGNHNVSQTMRERLRDHPDQGVYRTVAPIDGTKRLYAYLKFDRAPFYMTVGRTTAEFTQGWWITAWGLAALWLIMTAGLFWTARRLCRSAMRLHEQNRLLEGKVAERTRELELLNHNLQNILEGTSAGAWQWNVQTGEVLINPRWAEMLGYRPEELEPMTIDTWSGLAHP